MSNTRAHIMNGYEGFLKTYPEYKKTINLVAETLYREIHERGLPRNYDCLHFVNKALHLEEELKGEDYKIYQSVSGYSEPCGADITQKICESIDDYELPPLSAQFAGMIREAQNQKARLHAQGFTAKTLTALTKVLARDHLEAIAEFTREATLFAMLDDECVALSDIVEELKDEGLPHEMTPAQRYNVLVMHMSEHFADSVTKHISTLFDNPEHAPAPQLAARNYQDILRMFHRAPDS